MCNFLDKRGKQYEELSGPPQLSSLAFTAELTSKLKDLNLEIQGEGKTDTKYFISKAFRMKLKHR